MIDLHTHILPGLDDGAPDWECALKMAEAAYQQGINLVAATPHLRHVSDWPQIKEKVKEFLAQLKVAKIPLEVAVGAEIYADFELTELTKPEIPTYGDQGKYCLLEFPIQSQLNNADQILFSLLVKGITPVIAHPERYLAVISDPNIVLSWIKQGCLIQLNAGSILGQFGRTVQKTAETLVSCGMADILASDGHSTGGRSINLASGLARLKQLVGEEEAECLVEQNPQVVLASGDFRRSIQPRRFVRRKRFWFF